MLLRDDAAGDAIARVASRIGLIVVGFGVDDHRSAIRQERVRAVLQSRVFIREPHVSFAICLDREIPHIARVMAFRIIEPVLFTLRIEMTACRFEIRPLAFGHLVEMDRMFSG